MNGMLGTAVLAAAAVMAGLAPPVASAAAPGGALDRFERQRLVWKACTLGPDDQAGKELDAAGARCADVTVPLDYTRPDGPTIEIAISRLPASGRRIGTLVANGGGPGPAIDMPPYLRGVMKQAGPRYDIVGMDPRSLGRSAPVDCGWPTATWIRSAGETRRAFDGQVRFARDLARRCERRHPGLLPHISTANIARDMDIVRAALGERKISYSGGSYGTYLGAVYASLFPGRTDRMVLDSGVNPRTWGAGLLRETGEANEQALAHWADWAARRDAEYGLGTTRREVLGVLRGIVRASAREPLAVGRFRLDDTVVPVILFQNLQDDRDAPRAAFAEKARILARAASGEHVEPGEDLADDLGFLLSGSESRYGSGQAAIICGDAAAPQDPERSWREVERNRRRSPFFAGVAYNVSMCGFWHWTPREPLVRIDADAPALVVGATGDTRTVYASSRALHAALPGSRMVTLKGADVHAPYQAAYGNACVDEQVNGYLDTGVLPARDTVCER